MKTYVDSGVLVKLYSWEALSEAAVKLVADLASVPLTPLHELEIRNALRAQRGRGLISQKQLSAAVRAFEQDIYADRLIRPRIDWAEIFQDSNRLSKKYTPLLLCRSRDILHVVLARQIGCRELITGDSRQARLSEKIGLHAVRLAPAATHKRSSADQ